MSYLPSKFATAAQGALAASALQSIPAAYSRWVKYTKTFADLSAASLTNDIEIFQLPAKAVIRAVVLKHSASFAGGLIASYTISVGVSGTLTKYTTAFDVNQAPGATVWRLGGVFGMENFSTATSIRLAGITTVGTLDAATTGSVDIWILTATLP